MSLTKATGERGFWYFDEDKHKLVDYRPARKRANVTVIMDDIHNGMISAFNGKMYHSKSRLRADARAMGLIEIGNEDTAKVAERHRKERERESQQATHEALLEAWARRMGE